MWLSRKGKTTATENKAVVARGWGGGWGLTTKGHKANLGVIELFYILIVEVVMLLSKSVKTHRTAHLKWVKIFVYTLMNMIYFILFSL